MNLDLERDMKICHFGELPVWLPKDRKTKSCTKKKVRPIITFSLYFSLVFSLSVFGVAKMNLRLALRLSAELREARTKQLEHLAYVPFWLW